MSLDLSIDNTCIIPCELCEHPEMHCDHCNVNMCLACVGKHLSDFSIPHNIVPFVNRGSTLKHPFCKDHSDKTCELYCQTCKSPVCISCVSKHQGHSFLDNNKIFDAQIEIMKKDLEELKRVIHPMFEKTELEINTEKSNVEIHYDKLKTTTSQDGENLHREIDILVNRRLLEINELKTTHLALLNEQEEENTYNISKITQSIVDLNVLLTSNDISIVSNYISKNDEFRRLPPKIKVNLPSISPQKINREKLSEQFGSLFISSSSTIQRYSLETSVAESYPCTRTSQEDPFPMKLLRNKPQVISSFVTNLKGLSNLICLNDKEIWITDLNKLMNLVNIEGEVIKSVHTKSGDTTEDIAVTKSGDLIYTDYNDRSVNIVKNTQIRTLFKVRGWKPRGICCTSTDDLLVVLVSHDNKPAKVVRYSGTKEKQSIQFSDKGQQLYSSSPCIKYITESKNLDICVADNDAGTIVVVNKGGKLRFKYTCPLSKCMQSFNPVGITTDSQCKILTTDYLNNRILILHQDGQFLCFIDNCELQYPYGLCVDSNDNLFVAESVTGSIKKIQYYE